MRMIRLVLAYDVRVCVCVCVVCLGRRVCCVHFSESSFIARPPGASPSALVRYIYLLPTTNGWALASCFDLSGSVGARPPPLEGGRQHPRFFVLVGVEPVEELSKLAGAAATSHLPGGGSVG